MDRRVEQAKRKFAASGSQADWRAYQNELARCGTQVHSTKGGSGCKKSEYTGFIDDLWDALVKQCEEELPEV